MVAADYGFIRKVNTWEAECGVCHIKTQYTSVGNYAPLPEGWVIRHWRTPDEYYDNSALLCEYCQQDHELLQRRGIPTE